MKLVLDASVIIKWLLNDPEREPNTADATDVVKHALLGTGEILQPAHWLIEVAGTMSRLSPKTAEKDVALLQALNLPTVNNPAILQGACRLAIQLEHHVFDTLYHSVALETKDTVLITADHRYLRKAHNLGGLAGLSQWRQVLH